MKPCVRNRSSISRRTKPTRASRTAIRTPTGISSGTSPTCPSMCPRFQTQARSQPDAGRLLSTRMDELMAFERAVIAQGPPGAVLVGASVSPDGRWGAALTFQPGANYLMDDVLVRRADEREIHEGGSGGGLSWSRLGQEDRGVLRYGDEAPEGASVARIDYKGQQYRVPVRHGHFLFVAWDAPPDERPTLIGFEGSAPQ